MPILRTDGTIGGETGIVFHGSRKRHPSPCASLASLKPRRRDYVILLLLSPRMHRWRKRETNMEITIHDVGHGFCASVIGNHGNVLLVDVGHDQTTGFPPSQYLPAVGITGIDQLIVSNFDADHVSDLHNVDRILPNYRFSRNPSMTAPHFLLTKSLEEKGPV